jgi:probable rRNA maturation factor
VSEVALALEAGPLPLPEADLRAGAVRALELAGFEGRVSLAVVDDGAMRAVNRDYHGQDHPTDVLAFALREGDEEPGAGLGADATGELFDAEVVVSLDTALRESRARGVEPAAELLFYVVHGVLHLVGYDDHDPEDARRMHARALEILSDLGYENRAEA